MVLPLSTSMMCTVLSFETEIEIAICRQNASYYHYMFVWVDLQDGFTIGDGGPIDLQ